MTELKPCPFCGGIAKISGGISITPIIDENGAYVDADVDEGYGYTIQCSSCGCEIVEPWVSDEDDADEATWESVINKWNNRPNPWHTGIPTEEGDYLVKLDVEHNVYPYYLLKWNKKGWYSHHDLNYPACPQHSVLKWQKIMQGDSSDIELDGRAERGQLKDLVLEKIRDRCEMERYSPEIKARNVVCNKCEMRGTCEIPSLVQDIEGPFMSLKEAD